MVTGGKGHNVYPGSGPLDGGKTLLLFWWIDWWIMAECVVLLPSRVASGREWLRAYEYTNGHIPEPFLRSLWAFFYGAKCHYQCQNRWISGRGSRIVRLRVMVTGGGDMMFTQVRALSMEVIPYFLLD